jgi:hypothetical protein
MRLWCVGRVFANFLPNILESWRKHIGPLISRQGEELLPHKQSPLTDNRTVAPLVRSLREDSLFGVLNIARKALGQVLSNG